ncbi:hypothetical protein [Paenibacillus sp. FSL R7-0128]|uniref:hypothetical protein n=1 Tax=Paenibacillus sp. FSL R7-0128 TaxID=2954529 RepID=UPI0030FC857B
MKRKFTVVLLTLCLSLSISSQIFAESANEPVLVETTKVDLNNGAKSVNPKLYTLNEYLDDGHTVYAFQDIPVESRVQAFDYLKNKIANAQPETVVDTGGATGQFSGNDYNTDSRTTDAAVYTHSTINVSLAFFNTTITSTGGMSGGWFGSGSPSKIVLNQSATYNGVSVTVSWPASMTGTPTSKTWVSQPITNSNPAGASHSSLTATALGFTSVTFSDVADIYLGSQIYRPTSYLKFD